MQNTDLDPFQADVGSLYGARLPGPGLDAPCAQTFEETP